MSAWTFSRFCRDNERTVASNSASSGMMFSFVPPAIRPTVTTTGSKTSKPRVTIGLESQHHLAGDRDRVLGAVRGRAVTALAEHAHLDLVGRGAGGACARRPLPEGFVVGVDVQRVCRVDAAAGDVEQSFLDHRLGAARTLLTRLEHEDHVTGKLVAHRVEHARSPDESGHVEVVAARMHRTDVLGDVLDVHLLRDGQRIHVTAQEHDLPNAVGRFAGAPQDSRHGRE